MTIIGIDYEGANPPVYKAVTCKVDGKEYRFASGDPTRDYAAAAVFAVRRANPPNMNSSSVDHFVFDGGELDDSDETLTRLYRDDPELKRIVLEQEAKL